MGGIRVNLWIPARETIMQAVPLLLMAVAVFFFLASGYETLGVYVCIVSLLFQWTHIPSAARWRWIASALIPISLVAVTPLLDNSAIAIHLRELATELVVFGAAYTTITHARRMPIRYILYALALPLALHLAVFVAMIPHHFISHTDWPWLVRFEALRSSAKIGPKNLGQALALLIPLSCYTMLSNKHTYERRLARTCFVLACLCIALIDSRAACLCLAVGAMLAMVVHRRMVCRCHARTQSPEAAKRLRKYKQFVAPIAIACVLIAAVVGWHRLSTLDQTLNAAWHYEQYTAWITPDTLVKEFYLNGSPSIDASIYLRSSWIRFGVMVIAEHPFGIGSAFDPLEKALRLYYPDLAARHPVYDDFHSSIIDAGVNYGIPGILFQLLLLALPLCVIMRRARISNAPAYLPLLACLWGIWITRIVIDGINPSLWFTGWVYGGVVLALLQMDRMGDNH